MPDLRFIKTEIERMRTQVGRQRRDIKQLQEASIPTVDAEALLKRMQNKVRVLCAERDRLRREERLTGPKYPNGKLIKGTPVRRRA